MISSHYNNFLTEHFGIDKIRELVRRKHYWPSLKKDVETYVWECNMCLAFKAIRYQPYGDLQFLPIPTHWWKNLLIDFMTGLPLSADWKVIATTWFSSLSTD